MRTLWHVFRLCLRSCRSQKYTATKCGHRTSRNGWLRSKRTTKDYLLPLNEGGGVDYCHLCLSKMSVSCGYCGDPILIGDPIILFAFSDDARRVAHPEATIIDTKPFPLLIGCFSLDCLLMQAYVTGVWTPGEDGQGAAMKIITSDEEKPKDRLPGVEVHDSLDELIEKLEATNLEEMPVLDKRIH